MASKSNPNSDSNPEINIYEYHNYRDFLKDWFEYLKRNKGIQFSVRKLSKKSEVSESYISMVLRGSRSLSEGQLNKLLPHLHLAESDRSYLGWLRTITEANSHDERLDALKKIQRFREYQKMNPIEIETYTYLTHWYHVAIREMSALPEFQLDPRWIQKRLKYKVPLIDIKKSVAFLQEHDFIKLNKDGKVIIPDKPIHCKTGVLKPALTKFHQEMLNLAWESIDTTPSEERNISAHTAAIPKEKIDTIKQILEEARAKIINEIAKSDTAESDNVYHFSFLAFPLTDKD